ncbi:hypothetical protein E4U52_005034 [Claviceps spartinae]|nr:hypothetical protein E4U52_005034 [Claviceps spartinae]
MPNIQRKQASLATWFEEQYGHRPSLTTTSESLSIKFKDGIEVPITGDILREIAKKSWSNIAVYQDKELTSFDNEWLKNCKGSYGIRQRTRHGESGHGDVAQEQLKTHRPAQSTVMKLSLLEVDT